MANGGVMRPVGRAPRGRQIGKTFNNIKITILCGFVTILILRGTIGIGSLSSLEFNAVNQHLAEETSRILAEIRSDSDLNDPDDAILNIPTNSSTAANSSAAAYSLGSTITGWDEERKVWLSRNPEFPTHVNGRPWVLLLTGLPPSSCDFEK